jgi:FAD/FMN-containing dehydrogenase
MLNPMMSPGTRRYMKSTAVRHLTVPIFRAMFDAYVEYTQSVGPDAVTSACLIETYPRAKINSVPNDACAFDNRGEWHNITLLPNWNNRVDLDAYSKNWVHALVDQLAELEKQDEHISKDQRVVGSKGYFNASFGNEKPSLVFGDKLPRLRELKRKYDPNHVFNKWFPIVPADV